jgi:hypothetical protein
MVQHIALVWDGYSAEELQRFIYLQQTDFFVFSVIAPAVVLLLASVAGAGVPASAEEALGAMASTPWSTYSAAALFLASLVPLYLHAIAMPMNPKKESAQEWEAMRLLGRWPFLTRWGLTLQPVYFALSLVGEATGAPAPRRAAYALAVPVASVGAFVTVQFYTLVTRAPTYPPVVTRWTQRGVRYELLQALVHAPALLFGVADLHVAKQRALLHAAMPHYGAMVCTSAAFAALYLSVMVANKLLTGHYPYMMMAKLDTFGKFGKFAAVQVGVFQVFLLLAWLPIRFY